MRKSAILFFMGLFCNAFLMAQSSGKLGLEVQAGVGSYTTFSDFQRIVYTIEGRDFNQSYGNVAESDMMPFVSLNLSYQVNARLQFVPFVHYLFGKGTHYENDFVRFGVSDLNPQEQMFRQPADYELDALTAGLQLRYRLLRLLSNDVYLGTGLAFTTRSHYYRHEMNVDFGADRIAQRVDERFTTEKKSAVFIPVSAGLERVVSERLTLTLNAQGFIAPGMEDRAWSAGLGLRYTL